MTGFPIWGRDGIGIVPVGLYKPNPWGLFDMHGNASEWVQDYAGRYPRGPVTDPVGPSWAEYRIVRGHAPGSSALAFGRSAARMPFDREEKYYWSGFRVRQKVPVVLPGHYFPD